MLLAVADGHYYRWAHYKITLMAQIKRKLNLLTFGKRKNVQTEIKVHTITTIKIRQKPT